MQTGKVEFLFVGNSRGVRKQPRANIELRLDGIVGDRHSGDMKKADGRDKGVERGALIRNWRQWSAVSTEELQLIASNLNIPELDGVLLGPNLVISGISGFTQLQKGSLLKFPHAALLVEEENAPCTKAGKLVATAHKDTTQHAFVKSARGLRGLVGVVSEPGTIRVGDFVEVVPPPISD